MCFVSGPVEGYSRTLATLTNLLGLLEVLLVLLYCDVLFIPSPVLDKLPCLVLWYSHGLGDLKQRFNVCDILVLRPEPPLDGISERLDRLVTRTVGVLSADDGVGWELDASRRERDVLGLWRDGDTSMTSPSDELESGVGLSSGWARREGDATVGGDGDDGSEMRSDRVFGSYGEDLCGADVGPRAVRDEGSGRVQ
jgi:hypothetical protein